MDSATFRNWLAERGCRFDSFGHDEHRGRGQGAVTVRREGRTAQLPEVGSHKPIDPERVRAVCKALELDVTELPGPESRA